MIKVAAAIIEQDGKYLICQRPKGKHLEFFWEFPGGKMEPGETFSDCLVRECYEELGITIQIHSLIEESVYHYPEISIQFAFFLCEILQGSPSPQEGQKMAWIEGLEWNQYTFCPADEHVIKKLLPKAIK